MQGTKRVCFYCLHKLWLALALTLVLLAVLISVLRYSLPYADGYKQHIEQLIYNRYGADVSIGELSAGWQKYGPALLLKDVQLHDEQQQLQLSIAQTSVRLDFWRSLLNRQLTAQHFELSGLKYYIDADRLLQAGQNAPLDAAPVLDALETLFFRQLAYFSVVDSQLILQNDNNPDFSIMIKQLDWANSGNRHQGYGDLSLAGVTANTVSFVLDLYGDSLAQAFGQLYLQSEQLDVLPLFGKLLPPSRKLDQASINFAAWGRIDKGLLQRIQVELADNSLSWQHQGQQHSLQLGQGQLLWQPAEQGWSMQSGDLTLSTATQSWPGLQFQLHRQHNQWQAGLNQFTLAALSPLAQLLAEDIAPLQQLMQYQPNATLTQLQWHSHDGQWQFSGDINALSSEPVADVPGLQQVNGDFVIGAELARLRLHSERSQLSWDKLFNVATGYDELAATLYWQAGTADRHWRLTAPQLQLKAGAMQLDASLQLDHSLQILAKLQQADASQAGRFFPAPYMLDKVRAYLDQAIVGGTVAEATVLWHGKPADFPYREHQGVFQVQAQLEDSQFEFAPEWPQLSGLSAELLFDNANMQIHTRAGELAGIALKPTVSAEIKDLFAADTLDIRINQTVEASALTQLMLQSPLADNLGKTLQHLGATGQVHGDVLLAVGLKQPTVQAIGTVTFDDTELALAAPAMQLSRLQGKLTFDNEQIKADSLKLHWRGLPLNAALQGENSAQGYQLALQLTGRHQAQQLAQALHQPVQPLVEGATDWQLKLALNLPQSGFTYQAELVSDLQQTALLLPAPYGKTVADRRKLNVTANGNEQRSLLALHYNDQLHFHAELSHEQQRLSRAHLLLGGTDSGLNSSGFNVSIDLPQAEFLPWFELLQQQLSGSAETEQPFFPQLSLVRGKVARLDMAPGIVLNNTVFELTTLPDSWQLQLNGTEIASRWSFNKDWQGKGISAALDYLHLPLTNAVLNTDELPQTVAEVIQHPQRWLLQLPPLQLTCGDCSVGNYRFGKVNAKAQSTAEQWQLSEFSADYKRSRLTASGSWQNDSNSAGRSQFSGRLQTANLGAMLDEFQLTSAISGSSADIDFDLNWPGAPQQFAPDELAGKVKFALGEGSLTEVSDQGSRLFSIFSLDSLLRKLRLDFRDVFAKGFFYNSMSGNLAISQGVAQTSDAAIDGVPGNLQIQGYADLVSKELDYQMAFSPKVTSSLPVIIAWMVNPATGLAALALDEVFQSAEVISKINFTVTGSFDKPVVTEVNRHSTEVPVPVRVAQPEAIINLPAADQPHG